MRSLKPMHRVGRPQLARLHNQSQQARSQRQKKQRIARPSSNTRTHRQDSNTRQASGFHFRTGLTRKIELGNQRHRLQIAPVRPTAQHMGSNVYPGPNLICWLPGVACVVGCVAHGRNQQCLHFAPARRSSWHAPEEHRSVVGRGSRFGGRRSTRGYGSYGHHHWALQSNPQLP